jgi:hypothetical protein
MSSSRTIRTIVVFASLLLAVGFWAGAAAAQDQQQSEGEELTWIPQKAKPGECYAKVFVPPKYRTVTEKVLLKEPSEKIEIIPAQYEMVEEKVMVEPESEKWEVVPAEYKWVEEKIVIKEASSRLETIPAKLEWKEEKVLVKPAETKWKKGRGPIERIDYSTGEIMCLVEEPATYKVIKKQVVSEPAKTVKVDIPAEYGTVKQKALVSPPTVKKVKIPAKYETVKVRKMVSPPQEKRIPIQAEYQTVTRTEKVSDGKFEWARILCETNTTPDFVKRVQKALAKAGLDPGPIDGAMGPATQTAIQSYQQKNGLSVGALTYETVEKLGIQLR